VLVLRDQHPRWGPTRIVYELTREGVDQVPGRSGVYRALVRNGRIDPNTNALSTQTGRGGWVGVGGVLICWRGLVPGGLGSS
jgi:hypothetical protein